VAKENDLWVWGKFAERSRILHSMLRVANLDRALEFYCGKLGMNVLARYDVEAGEFSIVFLSFGTSYDEGAIELTHNWDSPANQSGYTHGNGYGHIAIGVPDLPGTCERLQDAGVEITVQPKVLFVGGPALAFVKDPDGYAIELIQTSQRFPGTK
jgi:lactoylglutathione lyase